MQEQSKAMSLSMSTGSLHKLICSSPLSQTRLTNTLGVRNPEAANLAQPTPSSNPKSSPPFGMETTEALVDALRQCMAANAALEAAVKMQAEDIRRQAMELSAVRKENSDLQLKLRSAEILNSNVQPWGPPPQYEDEVTVQDLYAEILNYNAQPSETEDAVVEQDLYIVSEPNEGASNTIDVGVQTECKTRKRRTSVPHDMKPMTLQNTSPLIAEAFRLGWLAGADAKPHNDSEPSTRSDDTISEPVTESVSSSSSSPGMKESLPSRASTPTPATPRST